MNPVVAQLSQSGAADGDVITWDDAAGMWVPATPAGGGGSLPTGGTAGQVLTKQSSTDGDADWQTPSGGSSVDTPPVSPGSIDYEFDGTTSSLPSGWSWNNQGSATWDEADDKAVMACPSQAYNIHSIRRAVPAGSAWQVTAKFSLHAVATNTVQGGLLLADSSGTKMTTLAKRGPLKEILIGLHNNVSSFAGTLTASNWYVGSNTHYVRLTKNSGTSYDFHVSENGTDWIAVFTAQDLTAHLATIDTIGLHIDPEDSGGKGELWVHWFRQTA